MKINRKQQKNVKVTFYRVWGEKKYDWLPLLLNYLEQFPEAVNKLGRGVEKKCKEYIL